MIERYKYLGWDLSEAGSQLICECPFCGKEKMYVDPKKTTYNCKVCDERGNAISVLGNVHEKIYKPDLGVFQRSILAKRRGLPAEAFKYDPNLGWDRVEKKPVWCVRKPDGTPLTLRHGVYKKKRYSIRNMKATNLGILGAEYIPEGDCPIYLTEGEWDRIALIYLLKKLNKPGVVVSSPGSGVFKQDWIDYFKGRELIVCYDYDIPDKRGKRAGYEGAVRLSKYLKSRVKKLYFLSWEAVSSTCDSYDVHDLVLDNLDSLEDAWKYIADNCEKYIWNPDGEDQSEAGVDTEEEQIEQENLEPITSDELHAVFNKWLSLENCDLIDITMGCLWSTYLPGDPLWMFIVAPPSGSKTESLTPCSHWHVVRQVSTVTAKSLISGFHGEGGADPSLFAEIDGKQAAMIIKDLTPLLEGDNRERDEVFGLLRDAYDGQTKKLFGNGVRREYNRLNFALIAGVTPAIDLYHGVAMGERFLKFRADKELAREDDRDRAFKAIDNSDLSEEMRNELREACLRCLARKFDMDLVPRASEQSQKYKDFIVDMAEFCAKARAVAPFDRFSGIQEMTPVQEALPRLTKQFIKLSQGLALHYGVNTLDDPRIIKLIKRIAIHTPDVITVRIIRTLASFEGAIDLRGLYRRIKEVSMETLRDVLTKLERTKICQRSESLEGKPKYDLQDQMKRIIDGSQLFSALPKNDPFHMGRRLIIANRRTYSGTGSTKDTVSISRKRSGVKTGRGPKTGS